MGIERLKEFWPEWKIQSELGEGAFGKVYKAVDEEAGFPVYSAIKVLSIPSSKAELDALRSEGMTERETNTYFKEVVDSFVNEIKLMHTLKGAPNIVGVEQFKIAEKVDTVGWDIFIRMELLTSFKDYINNRSLSEGDAVKLGIDIATALEICQKENIIHRDIKPANIFVDKYGSFKLGDFGIAKELEKTTGAVSAKGTFSYMAPEVARGMRYDNTVDIYSLGLVMYNLLNNNRPPFVDPHKSEVGYNDRRDANDRRLAGEPLPPPCNASPELAEIILAACSYDPAKRFRSATAFKNALRSVKPSLKAYAAPTVNTKPSTEPLEKSKPEPKQEKSVPNQKKADPKQEYDQTVAVAHKPQSIPKPEEAKAPVKKKKPTGIIVAIAAILVVVIAAILIPMLLKDGNSETPLTTEQEQDFSEETEQEKDILNQVNIEEQGVTGDVEWFYSDNTLVISGNGAMGDYEFDYSKSEATTPWYRYKDDINEVYITDGVTSIGDYAFCECTSLTSISIPDSVTSIGDLAFYYCTSLTSISIPDSVTSIGDQAFHYCSSLTSISIPDSVTSIGHHAFFKCTSLTSISIPDSVTSIGSSTFYYCTSLTSISIPDSVTSIGGNAFYRCTSLTSISIPDSVTSIGGSAFCKCSSLTSISIPDSVTSIGDWAFYLCDALTINCPAGSYAEEYAIEHNIEYTTY